MYVQNMVDTAQKKPRRGLPAGLALVLLIALIVVVCVLPFFALSYVIGYFGEGTRPVPGSASAFDPIASFAEVSKYAGDNVKLKSMTAYYVRSDGTLDLNASYRPYVDYEFYQALSSPPRDAPPVGAGGSPNQKWYQEIQVKIQQPRTWHVTSNSSEYDYYDFGMSHDLRTPTSTAQASIPSPTCSFKNLWSTAMQNGAPTDAVAEIEYNENGYEFSINDINIRIKFSTDCRSTESTQ